MVGNFLFDKMLCFLYYFGEQFAHFFWKERVMVEGIREKTCIAMDEAALVFRAIFAEMPAEDFLRAHGVSDEKIELLKETAKQESFTFEEMVIRVMRIFVCCSEETKDGYRTLEIVAADRQSTVEILLHAA
jgi:hypothetical protein